MDRNEDPAQSKTNKRPLNQNSWLRGQTVSIFNLLTNVVYQNFCGWNLAITNLNKHPINKGKKKGHVNHIFRTNYVLEGRVKTSNNGMTLSPMRPYFMAAFYISVAQMTSLNVTFFDYF